MELEEQSFSSDVSGDPEIRPNRGPNHQAEIPIVMSASEYRRIPHDDHEARDHIPIIWIKDVEENNKHDPLKHPCNSIGVTNENGPEIEAFDTTLVNGNSNVQQETNIWMHEKNRGKGYSAVPETPSAPWNELEKDSFTLGLYVFGKNFAHVEKLVGTKKMKEIQSFYYGKFYKSDAYRRWHECKRTRSRKCINYGQKIFTGQRQEFFSRLLQNISAKCFNKFLKVSQKFMGEEMNLPEYVFTLKDSVGLKALVEAVAIGQGERDLTGMTVDSKKSKAVVRAGTPIGKDCSKLTPAEIISILKGNFRLSKTRSTNLFWEAVWPRLLAKGWHSEQPNGDKSGASSSKQQQFFMIPGVTKFSRKLVMGTQYFDSISDVLTKVGADPGLIELDTVANIDCTSKEGNGLTKETKSDHEISPDLQPHCYLKPRTPNGSTDVKKFTIMDTSLGGGKMRELRSLPNEVVKASAVEYGNDDEDTSEEQTNEADIVGNMSIDKGKTDSTIANKSTNGKGNSSDMIGTENNSSKQVVSTRSIGSTNPSVASKHKKTDLLSNMMRRDAMRSQSFQRVEPDIINFVLPVQKRGKRSNNFSRAERNFDINSSSIFRVPGGKQDKASSIPDKSKPVKDLDANISEAPRAKKDRATNPLLNSKFTENVIRQETPAKENKTLADPLYVPSSNISKEAADVASSSSTKDQHVKFQPNGTFIDLNLSPEADTDEVFVIAVVETQKTNTGKEPDDPIVETISEPVDHSKNQHDMKSRRKSRRSPQPTIKVLEALANGYLDINERRKRKLVLQDNLMPMPRTSRCTRPKVAGETSHNGVPMLPDFRNEERVNVGCDGSGHGNGKASVICAGFMSGEGYKWPSFRVPGRLAKI